MKNSLLKKTLALYTNSQDLYYSYKMARQAIIFNKSIKKCIIGISYYSLFYDMSKSRMKLYTNIIYKYILNDLHNYKNDNSFINSNEYYFSILLQDIVLKDIFMINNMQENIFFNYYNKHKNLINEDISESIDSANNYQNFSKLDINEKNSKGKYYASLHNKHYKHKKTRLENYSIFNNFIEFLVDNNVEPIVVVFPSTSYYNKYLIREYKDDFYNALNDIKKNHKQVKFIDLNNYNNLFDDSDFYDESHLNEKGAYKATKIINNLVY